jgi:hypothetical protein
MTTTWATALPLATALPSLRARSCAQVLELPQAPAGMAHVMVGYGAVAFGGASSPLARLARPQVQVQGTSVPNGKQSVIGTDPVGGVRGIPPRGWPV